MPLLLVQTSLYVCTGTGCGWRGTARALGLCARTTGSVSSNNHASRRPDCPYVPCLVLERTPGQSRKQDAEAYIARCTREQRDMGMPPTGGCAPCMPTPEGFPDGYQWVAVELQGAASGDTIYRLNHNGRYMMNVRVPDNMTAGTDILLVEMGNKRKRSVRERQQRAERQAATIERATAKSNAAELAADERAAAERAATERAAAKRAAAEGATAEAKRLAAAIAAQSDAHSVDGGSLHVHGGRQTSFSIGGDPDN